MTKYTGPKVLPQLVEAALTTDRPGVYPRSLLASLPDHSLSSIRSALLHLVREGRVVREGKIGYQLYRRALMTPVASPPLSAVPSSAETVDA